MITDGASSGSDSEQNSREESHDDSDEDVGKVTDVVSESKSNQSPNGATGIRVTTLWDTTTGKKSSKEGKKFVISTSAHSIVPPKKIFQLLDVRRKNEMTFHDFEKGLKKIGFKGTEEQITSMFSSMDQEGINWVDEEAFLEWVTGDLSEEMDVLQKNLLQAGVKAVVAHRNRKNVRHRGSLTTPASFTLEAKQMLASREKRPKKEEEEKKSEFEELRDQMRRMKRMESRKHLIFREKDKGHWSKGDMLDLEQEILNQMNTLQAEKPLKKEETSSKRVPTSPIRSRSYSGFREKPKSPSAATRTRARVISTQPRQPKKSAGPSGRERFSFSNIFSRRKKPVVDDQKSKEAIAALHFSSAEQDEIRNHFASLLDSGTAPVKRTRLMIMGPSQSGKTALFRSLCGMKPKKDLPPTPGIVYRNLSISKGECVSSEPTPLADTLARLTVQRMRIQQNASPRTRSSKCSISLEEEKNQKNLDWELIHKYNKGDDAALEESDTIHYHSYEYSGLDAYNTIYHHFVSRFGVFLLVFSLRSMIDDKERKKTITYLQQVLGLISRVANGAPIIMVATCRELTVKKQLAQISDELTAALNRYPAWRFVRYFHEKQVFFSISNLSKSSDREKSASAIRRCLTEVTIKDGGSHAVPVEWYQVLCWILQEKESGGKVVIKLSQIQSKFPNAGKLEGFLSLLNEIGVILYFAKWDFCDTFCVVQPRKFLAMLNAFLCPPPISEMPFDKLPPLKLYNILVNHGVFSLAMLQCFESCFSGEYEFMKHVLQRLGMVSPWNSKSRFTLKLSEFLIPTLLPDYPQKDVIDRKAQFMDQCHVLRIVINPTIPWGFRPRFLGRLVKSSVLNKDGPRTLKLSKRMSLLSIAHDEFIIETAGSTGADEVSRSFKVRAPISSSANRLLGYLMKACDASVNEFGGMTYSIKLGTSEVDYLEARKALNDDSLAESLKKWFETDL